MKLQPMIEKNEQTIQNPKIEEPQYRLPTQSYLNRYSRLGNFIQKHNPNYFSFIDAFQPPNQTRNDSSEPRSNKNQDSKINAATHLLPIKKYIRQCRQILSEKTKEKVQPFKFGQLKLESNQLECLNMYNNCENIQSETPVRRGSIYQRSNSQLMKKNSLKKLSLSSDNQSSMISFESLEQKTTSSKDKTKITYSTIRNSKRSVNNFEQQSNQTSIQSNSCRNSLIHQLQDISSLQPKEMTPNPSLEQYVGFQHQNRKLKLPSMTPKIRQSKNYSLNTDHFSSLSKQPEIIDSLNELTISKKNQCNSPKKCIQRQNNEKIIFLQKSLDNRKKQCQLEVLKFESQTNPCLKMQTNHNNNQSTTVSVQDHTQIANPNAFQKKISPYIHNQLQPPKYIRLLTKQTNCKSNQPVQSSSDKVRQISKKDIDKDDNHMNTQLSKENRNYVPLEIIHDQPSPIPSLKNSVSIQNTSFLPFQIEDDCVHKQTEFSQKNQEEKYQLNQSNLIEEISDNKDDNNQNYTQLSQSSSNNLQIKQESDNI